MTAYNFRGKLYTILPCITDDIPSHIEKVFVYWNQEEVELQKSRMLDAVKAQCAYKLIDSSGQLHTFAYYEQIEDQAVNGIAMWWSHMRLFFMFGLWFRDKKRINVTYIYPHKDNVIAFEPLIEDWNLSWYRQNPSKPLVIDLWSPKCERIKELIDKLGIVEI